MLHGTIPPGGFPAPGYGRVRHLLPSRLIWPPSMEATLSTMPGGGTVRDPLRFRVGRDGREQVVRPAVGAVGAVGPGLARQ